MMLARPAASLFALAALLAVSACRGDAPLDANDAVATSGPIAAADEPTRKRLAAAAALGFVLTANVMGELEPCG